MHTARGLSGFPGICFSFGNQNSIKRGSRLHKIGAL